MFFQVSQLKAANFGIPEAVEVALTYSLAIYRYQCSLILCSLYFQPVGDVWHSYIFACHRCSWCSNVFSYCKLVDLQHCCQQLTNNAILDPGRNVCLSTQTQRALDLPLCAIFQVYRPGWEKTSSLRWGNWDGFVPFHYCCHICQKRRSMANPQSCRMGCRCYGLAFRHPLWILYVFSHVILAVEYRANIFK